MFFGSVKIIKLNLCNIIRLKIKTLVQNLKETHPTVRPRAILDEKKMHFQCVN